MKQSEAEILGKLMEIARLKKEIVQAIVPEKTYRHLEVIGNEFKALIVDMMCDSMSDNEPEPAPKKQPKVKKVDID